VEEILAQLELEVNAHHDPEGSSVGVLGSGAVVSIRAQGELGQAAVHYQERPVGRGGRGGKRQAIEEYTPRSRKRFRDLLKVMNYVAMMAQQSCKWCSVTYPDDYPSARASKEHWFALRRRIERKYGKRYIAWRLGAQKRGAPHYHFMVFGVPWLSMGWLRSSWGEVIGYDGPARLQVDVQQVREAKRVAWYLTRYEVGEERPGAPVAEAEGPHGAQGADVLLDPLSYLAADERWERPGRFWGEWNKGLKVLADSMEFEVPWGPWFPKLKVEARGVWDGVNDRDFQGFTLYMGSDEFLEMVGACLYEAGVSVEGGGQG